MKMMQPVINQRGRSSSHWRDRFLRTRIRKRLYWHLKRIAIKLLRRKLGSCRGLEMGQELAICCTMKVSAWASKIIKSKSSLTRHRSMTFCWASMVQARFPNSTSQVCLFLSMAVDHSHQVRCLKMKTYQLAHTSMKVPSHLFKGCERMASSNATLWWQLIQRYPRLEEDQRQAMLTWVIVTLELVFTSLCLLLGQEHPTHLKRTYVAMITTKG